MRMQTARFRFFFLVFALAGLAPAIAMGADDAAATGQPAAAAAPNPSNALFAALKSRCDTDVSCGKADGDICADAAALLLGSAVPDGFREMNEGQRIKIALRLLEKGVDSSNLAAGRAYDLYASGDFLLGLASGTYADPYRAAELMELMTRKAYPGAALRKARSVVSFFSLTVGDPEKRQGCGLASRLKAEGKLDADSARIADQVLDSNFCKNLAQAAPK